MASPAAHAPITLYTFGPFLGAPDSSPFVMKAMMLLKLAGLAYREDRGGLARAPRGLLPYIDDDGVLVPDSSHIRSHIERKYQFDFDVGLAAEQKAVGWAVEKMCEDHLYFALLHLRWSVRANFRRGLSRMFNILPMPARPIARFVMRRRTIAKVRSQGTGLHSPSELAALAIRDIEALATLLGSKPYLFGNTPCGADATVFGFVATFLTPELVSPIIDAARNKPNLIAYRDRILRDFFSLEQANR